MVQWVVVSTLKVSISIAPGDSVATVKVSISVDLGDSAVTLVSGGNNAIFFLFAYTNFEIGQIWPDNRPTSLSAIELLMAKKPPQVVFLIVV